MALLTLISDIVSISTDVIEPGVSFSKRASWNSHEIMNRSSGVLTYSSSDAMTFSFSFAVYATESVQEVTDACNSIKGLVYPIEPGVMPPPVCYLTYAPFKLDNWMCVASSVEASNPSLVWNGGGENFHAMITVSLLEVDLENIPASQFAGTINNLTSKYKGNG